MLYFMEMAQRTEDNHALEFAKEKANESFLPLVVLFVIPSLRGLRQLHFMAEGLKEVGDTLREAGITFCIRRGNPLKECLVLAERAHCIVCDQGYLRHQRTMRRALAYRSPCTVYEVETDVIVPLKVTYPQEAYSMRAFRQRVERVLPDFLLPLPQRSVRVTRILDLPGEHPNLESSGRERTLPPHLPGGTEEAKNLLRVFIAEKLPRYAKERSDPLKNATSCLSPYLRFGHISPLTVALAILREYSSKDPNVLAYFSELILWREFARNFVFYNPHYDSFWGLPTWVRKTLLEHQKDPRPYVYTQEELEKAKTHDPLWNAAQRELTQKGFLHNTLRMYWAKKILEWTDNPRKALETALSLNNTHALDGEDPNSYLGVAWCFGKADRPWPERPIFGHVRVMTAQGMSRKFATQEYIRTILDESQE
ncbi:MAG: deoxyribodipyrimidine photo-lyase [Candidatus Caldatribacteriaceae bacterium]